MKGMLKLTSTGNWVSDATRTFLKAYICSQPVVSMRSLGSHHPSQSGVYYYVCYGPNVSSVRLSPRVIWMPVLSYMHVHTLLLL